MRLGDWLVHPLVRGVDADDPRAIPLRRVLVQERVFVRRIYEEWYAAVVKSLPNISGTVLELGSGAGFLRNMIPDLVTSELSVQDGVRLVLDGQSMPIAAGALRAVVMTNVLHHLPEVRRFVRESARCVRTGGRLVMIEPWVSPWSAFVYRRLHHEPFVPDARTWEFPRGGPLSAANIALPWMLFVRDRARFEQEFPEWRIVEVIPMMPFRYIVSGGVSVRALTPAWTFGLWRGLERVLEPWMASLGMFVHIVLERTDVQSEGAFV